MVILLLLAALGVVPSLAADPPPGVQCDGVYCRETEDRDWHVRICGELVSPAGVYVVVTGANSRAIFRGRVPKGEYPPESPYRVTVPRDGVTGNYLLTLFGTQADYAGIRTPYTDLPLEVYTPSHRTMPFSGSMSWAPSAYL